MTEQELDKLKYPIGRMPEGRTEFTQTELDTYIKTIDEFPAVLKKTVSGLTDRQLDTRYRPEGWTPRIIVHHVGDSHMNAYIRMKLALTEDEPIIKPYFEDQWAKLTDYRDTPLDVSFALLESLHKRWVILMKSISYEDTKRCFFHPEHNKEFSIGYGMCIYAWHSDHHLAHITELKKRMGW